MCISTYLHYLNFILQLNVSGCECTPTNCEQTNIVFQQLQQSTKHCFADFNYPINDVAKNILNDADDLRTIIEQLHSQNPPSQTAPECSFSLHTIEANVMVAKELMVLLLS